MAQKQQEPQPDEIATKAARFAAAEMQVGWELGWLVASSVERGSKGRPAKNGSQEPFNSGRVSINRFAELSERPRATIQRYLKMWELAAEDGQVPSPESLDPAATEMPEEISTLEDLDGLAHGWEYYLQWARSGKRPEDEDEDSFDENESETESEESSASTEISTQTSESESDPLVEAADESDAQDQSKAEEQARLDKVRGWNDSIQAIVGPIKNFGEIKSARELKVLKLIRQACEDIAESLVVTIGLKEAETEANSVPVEKVPDTIDTESVE